MDGLISVSVRYFLWLVRCMDGWMEGCIDGWIDSVSLKYSFCGKSDGWMDG